MENFVYYTPTKVAFGKGVEAQAGALALEYGAKKLLVHYGGESARASGLLDRVCESLRAAGLEFVCLGGVVPNPHLSLVREGIALARKEGVDFLLAVGGGSVIDSAKAIGYGLGYDGDVWDFYSGKAVPKTCAPIGAVLTIAAAGSEMSNSSVITNEETGEKRGCNQEICRCRFALMNPELTYTLPAYQTACGCVDIFMHTMERYFSCDAPVELTDAIAEALMRSVLHNSLTLMADPLNYEARATVMWASSLSHNGLTGCGLTGDWSCHQLGHELSGMFDCAHGAALSAVWGSWARQVCHERPQRFAQFAVNVLRLPLDYEHPEHTAREGISTMESFFNSIGMPVSLRGLDIEPTDEQLVAMSKGCSRGGARTIGTFKTLDEAEMLAIYRAAL